jgi:alpha-L-fucosidase
MNGVKWQHINTIGYSWGYNKMQNKTDYKSKNEIYNLYNQVNNLGGTFLINLGPNENAEIIKEELEALNFYDAEDGSTSTPHAVPLSSTNSNEIVL